MNKKKVAVTGAAGVAGQQFLASLSGHPFCDVAALAASERSAGKSYQDALTDASGAFCWYCQESLDPAFAGIQVKTLPGLTPRGWTWSSRRGIGRGCAIGIGGSMGSDPWGGAGPHAAPRASADLMSGPRPAPATLGPDPGDSVNGGDALMLATLRQRPGTGAGAAR
jgi:hypothetical protein